MTEAAVESNESVPKETGADGDKDIGPKKANGSCRTSTRGTADENFANLNLINPFVNSLAPQSQLEKIQTVLNSVLLVPIRFLGIIVFLLLTWLMACCGLCGMSKEDIAKKPLTGWRKGFQRMARVFMRLVFVSGTIHWVKIIGKQSKKAPIVVVAPHSSFFDSLVAVLFGPPSVVAKAETSCLPFFGKIIDLSQPIYVCREDPDSRNTTIQAIKDRANSPEDWPPLLIFPEGTCTNREALLSFKLGAFFPGVPIQPIIIRYPNRYDSFTWTWSGPGPIQLLWLTLTKGFSNVEVEFLPVYMPSEEEKLNAKLYAKNVQQVMSKALDMTVSDFTYNDCKTMARARDMGLGKYLETAEIDKLRQNIGLNRTNVEEQIISACLVNDDNQRLNYADFCLRLQIAQNGISKRMFELFQRSSDEEKRGEASDEMDVGGEAGEQLIDFREYLLSALLLIKFKAPVIQLLELAFKLYGGVVSKETFIKMICPLMGKRKLGKGTDLELLYKEIKKSAADEDRVTFDEFSVYAEQKPKYSYIFTTPKEIAP